MGHIKKGELTQEEKELLEVIGKGTGAGVVPGCCAPGRGAWRSLGARSRPGRPWTTCDPEKKAGGRLHRGGEYRRQKHCCDQIVV